MRPLRAVVGEPRLREGRGGLLGGDTNRRTRWWDALLECGHQQERTVKYAPRPRSAGLRAARSLRDVLPPPRRMRCETCPSNPPIDLDKLRAVTGYG